MRTFAKIGVVAALVASLGACAQRGGPLSGNACGNNAGTIGGGLLGAVVGGVGGAMLGGGTGKLIATGVGTLLGAGVGVAAGSSLDRGDCAYETQQQGGGRVGGITQADLQFAQGAEQRAYSAPVGQAIQWQNPQSGNSGSFTPVRQGTDRNGRYCREFQTTIIIGGRPQQTYGTACQAYPNGPWEVVSAN